MTGQEVMALVRKHGGQRAAAKAAGVPKTTFRKWVLKARFNGVGSGQVGRGGQSAPTADTASDPAQPGGFSLRGVNLLEERPQGTIKKRLFSLRRGMGYKLDDLSKEWHMTVETLRKHAKDYNALRYVELTPGEYVACIVHPDTVKEGAA